jgi:hypothetical protein
VHVHRDVDEGAGLVNVAGELQLLRFNEVHEIPHQMRQLDIPLEERPCGVDDRTTPVHLPIALTGVH